MLVPGISAAVSVGGGDELTCALRQDGHVACYGARLGVDDQAHDPILLAFAFG